MQTTRSVVSRPFIDFTFKKSGVKFVSCLKGEAYRDAVVLSNSQDHSSIQAAVVKLDDRSVLAIPNCSTTSLRLTQSTPFQAGAVWYSSFQSIEDGFDTIFSFRVSESSAISSHCLTNSLFA